MKKFRSLTVAALREMLESFDDDTLVTFASNYGDIGNTMQVHSLSGDADVCALEESAYSASGFAVRERDEDEDEDDDEDDMQKAVVIRASEWRWL